MLLNDLIYNKLHYFDRDDAVYIQELVDNIYLKEDDRVAFLKFLSSIDESSSELKLSAFINLLEHLCLNSVNGVDIYEDYKVNLTLGSAKFDIYNLIYITEYDKLFINLDLTNFQDFVGTGYKVSLYNTKDNAKLATTSLDAVNEELIVDRFSYNIEEAELKIEDNSDDNILTIGHAYFVIDDGLDITVVIFYTMDKTDVTMDNTQLTMDSI